MRLAFRQRGDDETRVLLAWDVLGFGDDATPAAPTLVGAVAELGEDARRLARCLILLLRLAHRPHQQAAQALVTRQSEDVVDTMLFAPVHQLFAAEAGIGAHDDLSAMVNGQGQGVTSTNTPQSREAICKPVNSGLRRVRTFPKIIHAMNNRWTIITAVASTM